MSEDKKEWDETLALLNGNETVVSELSFGKFITITTELFDEMIKEINDNRIKNGDLTEGVDLIVISEKESDEDNVGSDED